MDSKRRLDLSSSKFTVGNLIVVGCGRLLHSFVILDRFLLVGSHNLDGPVMLKCNFDIFERKSARQMQNTAAKQL